MDLFARMRQNPIGGILTGKEIINQVRAGNIKISDFDTSRINPNSYNIRLGNTVTMYMGVKYFDLHNPETFKQTQTYKLDDDGFMLRPGMIYLIPTMEEIYSPMFEPIITGRSSIGRLGIRVHEEAGFADIGFKGHLTFQVKVTVPTIVYPGDPVAQIYFLTAFGDRGIQYNGKYSNTNEVASKWNESTK